jgi:leucyl/phenylalanyl-tRNA--protein transferase
MKPQVTVAMIPVDVLVAAYSNGRFPMCHEDGELYWHDPDPRAVFPLPDIGPNKRMERTIRNGRFRVTMDGAFAAVVQHCAARDETWIDQRIQASYCELHEAGHAHSVEVFHEEQLVGGIYGVALAGAFFGESMFSHMRNAGKVAFYTLLEHLVKKGFRLFDTQYLNTFTAQLGALEIPRNEFRRSLADAMRSPTRF